MKIIEITFTEEDDLKIWKVLNEYRQYRLTSNDGVIEMKKLFNEMANDL